MGGGSQGRYPQARAGIRRAARHLMAPRRRRLEGATRPPSSAQPRKGTPGRGPPPTRRPLPGGHFVVNRGISTQDMTRTLANRPARPPKKTHFRGPAPGISNGLVGAEKNPFPRPRAGYLQLTLPRQGPHFGYAFFTVGIPVLFCLFGRQSSFYVATPIFPAEFPYCYAYFSGKSFCDCTA